MKKVDLEKRINFLERAIRDYYRQIYDIKMQVGLNPGIYCCSGELRGNEESLCKSDEDSLKQMIKDLELWDCGC